MRASLFLTDSAVSHGDGTFSMLRAGINRVWADAEGDVKPIVLRGSFAAIFLVEGQESRAITFSIKGQHADQEWGPKVEGRLEFGEGDRTIIPVPVTLQFPELGDYFVSLSVNGEEKDRLEIRARRREAS